jgi:O-antigen/teichoic acid export membrane protein
MAATERASPFRRVVANTVSTGTGEFVGRIFSFFAVLHLSRVLLPAGLGVVDFGIAVFVFADQLSHGGAEVLAARRVARSEVGIRRLAGTSLTVSWVYFAGFGLLLAGAWASGWVPMPGTSLLFVLAAGLTPIGMRFAFWGREQLGVSALARVGSLAFFLLLCLTVVDSAADLIWMPFIWVAIELARVLPMLAVFRRRFGAPRFAFHASTLRVWVAKAFPISLSRVAQGLLGSLDILLLGILATPAAVGIYGAALRVPLFATVMAAKLLTATFPTVARDVTASDTSRLRLIHGELLHVVVGTGLPMVLALSLVADTLVTLLFGEAFRNSGPVLQILVWKALLVGVGGLYRNVVLARKPVLEMRVTLLGLAVTAAAILALVPTFGVRGAALGTLLGQATLLVGYALAARDRVKPLPRFGAAWSVRLAVGLGLVALASRLGAAEAELVRVAAVLAAGGIAALLVDLPIARRLWRELGGSSH